jgi:hypothetical protein
MSTTLDTRKIGRNASELLFRAVALKWYGVAPARVRHWQDTLAQAYQALAAGHPSRLVDLPEGATCADGGTRDEAQAVLDAFDDYLGRDIVWAAYEMASSGEADYDETA